MGKSPLRLSRPRWVVISVFLVGLLLTGLILLRAQYVAMRDTNGNLQAQIDELQAETARLDSASTDVENAILAKMRRGVPVHPVGNSPLFDSPLKERAIPVMAEMLRDPRRSVVAYTLHDLTRLLSKDADPLRLTPQLVPSLLPLIEDPITRSQALHILRQVKADPQQVIRHVLATIGDDTISLNNAALFVKWFDPTYDTMSLYIDYLQHNEIPRRDGEFLIRNAIRSRVYTPREFEMALKKPLLDVDDLKEQARLEQWIKYVQKQF